MTQHTWLSLVGIVRSLESTADLLWEDKSGGPGVHLGDKGLDSVDGWGTYGNGWTGMKVDGARSLDPQNCIW